MRYLFINTTCGRGSHGKICVQLSKELTKQGHECRIAYGRNDVPDEVKPISIRIGNKVSILFHVLMTRIFDIHGLASIISTKRFIKWADEYNPDCLWLHNIHGYYINYQLLFKWIKSRPDMIVNWTLHDCWSITGHCSHFTNEKCNKWIDGCNNCPLKGMYPKSILFDCSQKNYAKKRDSFCGVKNLTIITPSNWLANLVRSSYLKEYPIEVRYNEIDPMVFKHTESNYRNDWGLNNKIVILGVANVWNKQKGLDDFIDLAKMLDDDYAIVLVGLSKKQINHFPSYTKGIHKENAIYENVFSVDGKQGPIVFNMHEEKRTDKGVVIEPDLNALIYQVTKGKKPRSTGTCIRLLPKTNSADDLAKLYSMADFFIKLMNLIHSKDSIKGRTLQGEIHL